MLKLKLTTVFVICFVAGIFAQNRNVVVMEVEEGTTSTENSKLGFLENSSIKLNPLLFFRGDVPLYFETSLSSKVAAEIGIGFTHTDYLSSNTSLTDGFTILDDSKISYRMGLSGRVGLKYYASDYGYEQEGVYFGIDYRFQKYNSVLESCGNNTNLNQKLQRVNNDFRLTMGYLNYIEDNFFIEPYAGFGIRNRSIDTHYCGDDGFSSVTVQNVKDVVPFLSLGFKVGISF